LLNILNNGLQAAKHQATAVLSIDFDDQDELLVVRINDNGEGMSVEVQRRAMDKFFTTKPVDEGTGLGLSEVRELLSQVEGDLEIESSSPKGTTIKITLPYKAG